MVVFSMPLRIADAKEIAILFRGFLQRRKVAGHCYVSCSAAKHVSEIEGKFYAGN
jgi:hypothetical protein